MNPSTANGVACPTGEMGWKRELTPLRTISANLLGRRTDARSATATFGDLLVLDMAWPRLNHFDFGDKKWHQDMHVLTPRRQNYSESKLVSSPHLIPMSSLRPVFLVLPPDDGAE